jgi:hypothetical protein
VQLLEICESPGLHKLVLIVSFALVAMYALNRMFPAAKKN